MQSLYGLAVTALILNCQTIQKILTLHRLPPPCGRSLGWRGGPAAFRPRALRPGLSITIRSCVVLSVRTFLLTAAALLRCLLVFLLPFPFSFQLLPGPVVTDPVLLESSRGALLTSQALLLCLLHRPLRLLRSLPSTRTF